MSEAESEPRLPDGRPVWAATPEEKEAARRAAWRKAGEAAEAESARAREHEAAIEARLRDRLSAGTPSAAELKVDVAGLGPARSRLVVGRAWIAKEAEAIPVLEERLAAFERTLGMPEQTRDALAEIETSVGDAIRRHYAAGSPRGGEPDLRKAERDLLIEKLALEDALAAEVSSGLLREAEIEIEVQRRLVSALEGRLPRWESDCLVEIGAAIGPKVSRLVDELRAELSVLTALGQVVDPRSDLRHVAGGAKMALGVPWPWGDLDLEVPGGKRVRSIVGQWEKIKAAIEADPRANVTAPGDRTILPGVIETTVAEEPAPKATPGILQRAAEFLSAAPKAAPVPVPDHPIEIGYEFTDYRGPLG
jgi:hypothetical protein